LIFHPASEYSHVEELEELLEVQFPNEKDVYPMLVAYCDESETPHDIVPVVAVGGLLMSGKDSRHLATQWDRFLEFHQIKDKKGNRVFHTSEFESPGGRKGTVYEKMPNEHWDGFLFGKAGRQAGESSHTYQSHDRTRAVVNGN